MIYNIKNNKLIMLIITIHEQYVYRDHHQTQFYVGNLSL